MSSTPARRTRLPRPHRLVARPSSGGRSVRPPRSAPGPQHGAGGLDWARRIELVSILIASLVAVAGLWYSSVQTQQANDQARQERALTKEGQITDRFNAAVGNLGDEADEVRLGGIFALRRIMEDSPRDQPAVVDVLSGYIRTRAPAAGGGTKRDAGGRPAPDVRAAFETLTQRNPVHDKSARVDLRDTHLSCPEFRRVRS